MEAIWPGLLSLNKMINDICVFFHRDRVRYLTPKPPKDWTQINHTHTRGEKKPSGHKVN